MRASVIVSGIVAALVGFGGTLSLVVAAAHATGADAAQTASWVTALCLSMAAVSALLSLNHRIPIIAAWSTPGAALIASAGDVDVHEAVGAFLLTGGLIVLTAAVKPLGALIARIPGPLAAAMLAGILFRFVTAVFESAAAAPALVLPLIVLFLVARLFNAMASVLVVLVVGTALAFPLGLVGPLDGVLHLSNLTWITPTFSVPVLIGLGVPLYLVTMASQNLPGFAALTAAGYPVPARPILAWTGLASLLTAPFGAHTTNLAAITATICTNPDAHPDPAQRWKTGLVYGAAYVVLAAAGASLVGLIAALPAALIATFAGLALIGPLMNALGGALADTAMRFPAVLTLAVTASGVTFGGIGSAFWGLVAGLAALALERLRPPSGPGPLAGPSIRG